MDRCEKTEKPLQGAERNSTSGVSRPKAIQISSGVASFQPGGGSLSFHARYCSRLKRRSEEHTSELQSLMRISYAVFCLQKKKKIKKHVSNSNIAQQIDQEIHIHNRI